MITWRFGETYEYRGIFDNYNKAKNEGKKILKGEGKRYIIKKGKTHYGTKYTLWSKKTWKRNCYY